MHKLLKINILSGAILLSALSSGGQTLLALDSILTRIETVHPRLKGTDARIRELDTYAKGAITMPAPQVGGGFWMTPYNPERWREGMGAFMVSAEQMFPNRNMQKAEQRYMYAMSGMETAERGVMRNMLFTEAKNAYYSWLVMEKKIAVLEESKKALRLLIESAEQRYLYNREKLGSIYKAQSELANVERMQAMYTGEIRKQRAMLNTLMQRDPLNELEIDTTGWRTTQIPILPDTSKIASRSDFRAIEQNLHIARLEQEWQRSKLKPEFGLSYDHMFSFGDTPWQFSLTGMVTVPIVPWANKDVKARIDGIDYRIAAFELQKADFVNQVWGNLTDRLLMMQTLQEQIDRYEFDIIPNQRKRYQSTLLAWEQNTDELFMALDAWLELNMSRLSQLDLLQQLLIARIDYEKELELR
ncbi:MAG: TolC family protein [Saprospiraceae bacterium]|nr:TolC family protein [Saprospiraceae bacterium]